MGAASRNSGLVALTLSTALLGCAASPEGAAGPPSGFTEAEWEAIRALSPDALPAPPADVTNRFADDAKAARFGQKLFFDASFSGPLLDTDNDGGPQSLGKPGQAGKVACSGCHLPKSGFSDARSFQAQVSLGAGWGRRRAPSLLDVGQARMLMWDGRHDTLYNQVFGPLESVVEMNSSRLYEAEQMFREHKPDYEAIFGALPPLGDTGRFPVLAAGATGCTPSDPADPLPACDGPFHGSPGDHAEFDAMSESDQTAVTRVVVNAGKAIGAYERLLTCGRSPFDAWVAGESDAISAAAQRGAKLFVGKAKCASCHSGPYLSDQAFHNVGLQPEIVQQFILDESDSGAATGLAAAVADPLSSRGKFSDGSDNRLPVHIPAKMTGAFRTPNLRCVSARPAFMHTGQLRTLADVVAFFARGGDPMGYPGASELAGLDLDSDEQSDLVAMLESLAGPGPESSLLAVP